MAISTIAGVGAGSSGTILTTGAPQSGSILQVQSFQLTGGVATTTASMTATGLTVNITPRFSTSKILVMTNMTVGDNTNNVGAAFSIYRNGSAVGNSTASTTVNFGTAFVCINNNHAYAVTQTYLDSPATTNTLTYAIYWQAQTGGQTVLLNRSSQLNGGTDTYQGGYTSSITVMEVAA